MKGKLTVSLLSALTAVALAALLTGSAAHRKALPTPTTPLPGPTLSAVSPQTLDARGIVLLAPVGTPSVTEADATTTALANFPGTATEAVLAAVDAPDGPILDGCLCWVISVNPDAPMGEVAGPGESPRPATREYLLVFVDAETGLYRYGAEAYHF